MYLTYIPNKHNTITLMVYSWLCNEAVLAGGFRSKGRPFVSYDYPTIISSTMQGSAKPAALECWFSNWFLISRLHA